MKTKYYEIICGRDVIGVTCDEGDLLLHATIEDKVDRFGLITKAQFDKFNSDKEWIKPISKKIYTPHIKIKRELKLKRIK
jgi:hypothetical protein